MESNVFCLLLLLVLYAGTTYAVTTEIDTSTTIDGGRSNGTEPNTTVVPATTTTVLPTTATVTASTTSKGPEPNTTAGPTFTSTAVFTTQATTSNVTIETHTGTTEVNNGTTQAMTTLQPCAKHSFDGASFVGGIVLGLGLCGIAFFIFKWYQSTHRTAAPYQQF